MLSAQQTEEKGGISVLVVLCSFERHRVGRWRLLASFPQVGLGGPLALSPWFGFAGQPCWLSAVMCLQQVASSLHAPATHNNISLQACVYHLSSATTQQPHLCCIYCFFKVSVLTCGLVAISFIAMLTQTTNTKAKSPIQHWWKLNAGGCCNSDAFRTAT